MRMYSTVHLIPPHDATDMNLLEYSLMSAHDTGTSPASYARQGFRRTIPATRGKFRTLLAGNPFLLAVHYLLLRCAGTERSRARAVEGLGRSGNPLAARPLLEAADDPSPIVRKKAISALGKIRAVATVPRLLSELGDEESDVRSEAAEALGRIGDPAAISPLMRALNDHDARLRNTVVSALGEIGGKEVRERLLEIFTLSYDNAIFPALADSLSRLGVQEIVEPVMRRLGNYESMVIRLQFLNAVCRVLGAGNTFYRILSKHEYARVDEVNRLIRSARTHILRSPPFQKEPAATIERILDAIAESYRNEDHRTFLRSVWEFMASIQLIIPEIAALWENGQTGTGDCPGRLRPAIEAVNRFLILKETEDIRDEGMVFLVICIVSLLSAI